MYYEYWGLHKAPFDNVPDPSMYVESHSAVENAVAETLFAIEEGNECIAVIVGDVGSGKTLSFRLILDSLEQEKYRIAFITNPDITFVQLLQEIIGQITGKECEAGSKVELLEIFNKLLFKTGRRGEESPHIHRRSQCPRTPCPRKSEASHEHAGRQLKPLYPGPGRPDGACEAFGASSQGESLSEDRHLQSYRPKLNPQSD